MLGEDHEFVAGFELVLIADGGGDDDLTAFAEGDHVYSGLVADVIIHVIHIIRIGRNCQGVLEFWVDCGRQNNPLQDGLFCDY